MPPKGSFLDGVWHCDCQPALPAVHFPVKKEGANKGKWFRVCQKDQKNKTRCKFFLWDKDAAPRENAALLNNSRSEPSRANNATPSRAPPQKFTPETKHSGVNGKRSPADFQEEEDEYGLGDDNADFNEELDQVMIAAETPSKKKVRIEEPFTTPKPRRKLPWEKEKSTTNAAGLQTPQTEYRKLSDPFTTSASGFSFTTPSKTKQSDAQTLTRSSSPMDTPTPSRFKDVNIDSDLSRDVIEALRGANVTLSEQASRDLNTVLSKYATIAEGVKKGRDVARASMKAKDAKITELTYRVNTLEAELEAERKLVTHLQWKAEHGPDSD